MNILTFVYPFRRKILYVSKPSATKAKITTRQQMAEKTVWLELPIKTFDSNVDSGLDLFHRPIKLS